MSMSERVTYDDVLIPTDGSDRSQRAVEHGLELAEAHDATVHSMYVVDEAEFGETPALSSYELTLEQVEDEHRDLPRSVAEAAEDRGLDANWSVTRGRPHEEIVDYANREDVDVIVMGRTGIGEAAMPHIGSVTSRVLRTTDLPVFPV